MDATIRQVRRVSNPSDHEPPVDIVYELEEALDLLAAMEDARDALSDSDHLAVLIQVEHQVELLSRRLGFNGGDADVN